MVGADFAPETRLADTKMVTAKVLYGPSFVLAA